MCPPETVHASQVGKNGFRVSWPGSRYYFPRGFSFSRQNSVSSSPGVDERRHKYSACAPCKQYGKCVSSCFLARRARCVFLGQANSDFSLFFSFFFRDFLKIYVGCAGCFRATPLSGVPEATRIAGDCVTESLVFLFYYFLETTEGFSYC